MLRAATTAAAEAGVAIEFIQGSSYDLGPQLGTFRLVTIGRAFHWMDRVDTLRRLAAIVEPEGAVALFHDTHPKLPENRWQSDYKALIDGYAAGDPMRELHKSPDWIPHEAVLLDSPFARLERIGVIERRQTPVDRLVDRAVSIQHLAAADRPARRRPGRIRALSPASRPAAWSPKSSRARPCRVPTICSGERRAQA